MGGSLGAAVAIQSAADDPRVSAVVAVKMFFDFGTVANERAPFFFTRGTIGRHSTWRRQGHFDVDDVSPVAAAAKIEVPVLLIHGDAIEIRGGSLSSRFCRTARIEAFCLGPGRATRRRCVRRSGHDRALGSGRTRDTWSYISPVNLTSRAFSSAAGDETSTWHRTAPSRDPVG